MKQIYSSEGNRLLRASWIVLAVSILAAAAIIGGSQWFQIGRAHV